MQLLSEKGSMELILEDEGKKTVLASFKDKKTKEVFWAVFELLSSGFCGTEECKKRC